MRRAACLAWMLMVGGCAVDVGVHHPGAGGAGGSGDVDMAGAGVGGNGGNGGSGGGGSGGSGGQADAGTTFTVYAHSNTTLYTVDIANKMLVTVGDFKAPIVGTGTKAKPDVIQDLAVTPDNTIYVISKTTLYTADPKDGHVTVVGGAANVGSLKTCGTDNVALTTTPDKKLYAADFGGSFCEIDVTVNPPTVTPIGMLGNNMAISGDIVGLGDGSIYGTAYNTKDAAKMGSNLNNILVKLDPKTGVITQTIGPTGYPQLYGVAFAAGQVYGFTHDGSGNVIIIDPKTGAGTIFSTFKDAKGAGISFAGAGVNSTVPPPPIS